MKILITGGAGFIGSAVVRLAVREGYEVVNVDTLTAAGDLMNVASVEADRLYAFEEADIRHAAAMTEVLAKHQPDAVLHLAESRVDRDIDGPMGFVRTNITGTAVMLETVRAYMAVLPDTRREGFRFHHVSTDEVFGALGDGRAFTEESPYRPSSPYAASKAASDLLVHAWGASFGLSVVVSNASNNYGPFQHPAKLIPSVILNALDGAPIPVYGGGRQVRDWLYVEDHAAALLEVLMRGKDGESYCIGGEAQRSTLELVGMVCAALDKAKPRKGAYAELITFVGDRRAHDDRHALNNGKVEETLGWRPQVSLEAGIARTVRWYLDNEDWVRARAAAAGQLQDLNRAAG